LLLVSQWVALTYRNDAGQEIQLGWNTPFVITAGGGQESHANNVYGVAVPGRHGESGTNMRMDRRHIRLVGEVRGSQIDSESARYMIHNAFNPTIDGTLTSRNSKTAVLRHITCKLEELPVVEWSAAKRCLVFEIMLVALDPFWKGRPLVVAIAQIVPRWSSPTYIPQRNSRLPSTMVFGIQRATLETRFLNQGNVASGFTAEIRARHGTVTNPSIKDENTGHQIRMHLVMERDDVLVVENYLHVKRITLNGENALHLLDAAETQFFLIQVGLNRIGYRADENVSNMHVTVRYTPEYTFVGGFDPMPMARSPYLAENRSTGQLVENPQTERLLSRLIPVRRD